VGSSCFVRCSFLLILLSVTLFASGSHITVSGGDVSDVGLSVVNNHSNWFIVSGNRGSSAGSGNITGSGGEVYLLNLTISCDPGSYLLASTNSSFADEHLNRLDPETMDAIFGLTGASDSAVNTFVLSGDFNLGSNAIFGVDYTKTNKYENVPFYRLLLLVDQHGNMVFGTNVVGQKQNFDNETVDYQIMLPVKHSHQNETYYFKCVVSNNGQIGGGGGHNLEYLFANYTYNCSSHVLHIFVLNGLNKRSVYGGHISLLSLNDTTRAYSSDVQDGVVDMIVPEGVYIALIRSPGYYGVDKRMNLVCPVEVLKHPNPTSTAPRPTHILTNRSWINSNVGYIVKKNMSKIIVYVPKFTYVYMKPCIRYPSEDMASLAYWLITFVSAVLLLYVIYLLYKSERARKNAE